MFPDIHSIFVYTLKVLMMVYGIVTITAIEISSTLIMFLALTEDDDAPGHILI